MTLNINDKVPHFSLYDQGNNLVNIAEYKGKKVLVYFYPKADTPGCTKQTCLLNDSLIQLNSLNVDVIGISPDKINIQKKFAEKFDIRFPLLSDEEHQIAGLFDVWGEKNMFGKTYLGIIRSAFLIDEDGSILETWYKVTPKDTAAKALKKLKLLAE